MAKQAQAAEELYRIQHAIFVETGEHLRRLNSLLASGWRVQSSAPMGKGVFIVIEGAGSEEQIREFQDAFAVTDF